ncbi:MAG: DUF1553 domain-containing protein [Opitutae bacterium]|nr:DUF1553 domain-containing protein [Opitutae bacterium]
MPSSLPSRSIRAKRSLSLFILIALGTGIKIHANKDFEFFEAKIRPVLVQNCYKCHSDQAKKLKAGLYLDRKAGWQQGGENGPVIVPGKPEESRLITAISYKENELRMPPNSKLSRQILADFEKWIAMGAHDPRDEPLEAIHKTTGPQSKSLEDGRRFWAFKPLVNPKTPVVKHKSWISTELDKFIIARLEGKGLQPADPAGKITLLRRAYFDLTGLPPTPEQIDSFLADDSPEAYPRLIDELLGSPHYAERWGRHWLDVARYADTTGGGRNLQYKNAYRYRDYVLESYRNDKPFNLFIKQHIAGDLLPSKTNEEFNDNLIGTTFLALGPHNYELQDKALLRMEIVDEQIDAVGRAFLATTLGCARCHDHPFDPVPTSEYYSLAGIFRSTNSSRPGNVANFIERNLRDKDGEVRKAHTESLKKLEMELKELDALLKKLGGEKGSSKAIVKSHDPKTLNGIVVDDTKAKLQGNWKSSTFFDGYVGSRYIHDDGKDKGSKSVTFPAIIPRDGEYEVQVSYTHGTNRAPKVPFTVYHDTGEKTVFINQTKAGPILGSFISLGKFHFEKGEWDVVKIDTKDTKAVVIADSIRLIPSGEKKSPAKVVENDKPKPDPKSEDKKEQRKALSKQIQEQKKKIADHKKTAPPSPGKTMSVEEHKEAGDWHVHVRGNIRSLGTKVKRGFLAVATPSERSPKPEIPKGSSGRLHLAEWVASPENPLTARVYVNRVWHHLFGRGICPTTDNFGEMGRRPTHPELLDHLTSQFIANGWSTKKLIRTIMLSGSYRMSSTASESTIQADPENELFSRQNLRRLEVEAIHDSIFAASGKLDLEKGSKSRRAIYKKLDRNKIPEMFDVFDFPNPNLVSGVRNASTVPTQALFLLNNAFVINEAKAAAEHILTDKNLDFEERLTRAYKTTLGRPPRKNEKSLAAKYLQQHNNDSDNPEMWAGIFHSLYACVDFRYLR